MIEWMFLLGGILSFLLPVSVAFYLRKRFGVSWIFFVFGAAMFLLSLIRMPLNLLVQNNLSQYFFGTALLLASAFFPSLTAGLFEEGCRFLGYRYLFKPEKRNWHNGLMYGAGHGGIEVLLLVTANHLALFVILQIAPALLPAGTLNQIQTVPVYMPLVAVIERVFAMCLHIGLSILVLQCFLRGSWKYLGYAVGLHFAADFAALLISSKSIFLSEAAVAVFAVIALYIIWKLRGESS
jgi:uncharacterized membrane protein YhfC